MFISVVPANVILPRHILLALVYYFTKESCEFFIEEARGNVFKLSGMVCYNHTSPGGLEQRCKVH